MRRGRDAPVAQQLGPQHVLRNLPLVLLGKCLRPLEPLGLVKVEEGERLDRVLVVVTYARNSPDGFFEIVFVERALYVRKRGDEAVSLSARLARRTKGKDLPRPRKRCSPYNTRSDPSS